MPINGIQASAGMIPGTPTIGTPTAGNAQVSVAFTAPSYLGKSGSVTYRVVSNPGNIQATGSSSPVVVTGLTNGTSYTFTVRAEAPYGVNSEYSSASSSVSPINPVPSTIEYLVVAGGGGGNNDSTNGDGGGGAGGVRTATGFAVTAGTPITVTVGAGSAGWANGNNSAFSTIVSTGGGRGSARALAVDQGSNGGSGGGSSQNITTGGGGSGIAGQGNRGGVGYFVGGDRSGGGGGGAGAIGGNGSAGSVAGNGGNGIQSSISGTATFYGGGGGGAGSSFTGGLGGSGGGGTGLGAGATNGAVNSGGGGGAGGNGVGSGGSGIVIIRYSDSFSLASSVTGSPTITTTGGFRIYRWTGSGSITF